MSVDEAYDYVMKVLDQLEAKDIPVDRESRANADVDERGVLCRSKWMTASIHTDDLDMIFNVERQLADRGIMFDTGYGFGIRDWEIDWSFSVSEDKLTKSVKDMRIEIAKTILT